MNGPVPRLGIHAGEDACLCRLRVELFELRYFVCVSLDAVIEMLRVHGSRQTLSEPSRFTVVVIDERQSVWCLILRIAQAYDCWPVDIDSDDDIEKNPIIFYLLKFFVLA